MTAPLHKHSSPKRRRSWPRRLLAGLAWTGLVLLVLFAAATLPGAWRIRTLTAELDALVARLDRDEPGWRWDEFVPSKLPDAENGALKVLDIAKVLPKNWPDLPQEIEQQRSQRYSSIPNVRLPQRYLLELGKAMDRAGPARKLLSSLVGVKTGDYGWNHAHDGEEGGLFMVGVRSEKYDTTRESIRVRTLLSLEHDWLVGTHQGDRAAENLRAMLGHVRTWDRYPTLSSAYVRNTIRSNLTPVLKRFLARVEASDDSLGAIARDLDAMNRGLISSWLLKAERAFLYKALDQARAGLNPGILDNPEQYYPIAFTTNVSWLDGWLEKQAFMWPSRREVLLREQIIALRLLSADFSKCSMPHEVLACWHKAIKDHEAALSQSGFWVTTVMFSRWGANINFLEEFQKTLQHVQIAIACERYRLHHGRWPDDARQLVTDRRPDEPMYFQTDALPKLKRLSDGLVIYWGEPKDPNNIQVNDVINADDSYRPAPDSGIRLWNPDKRK